MSLDNIQNEVFEVKEQIPDASYVKIMDELALLKSNFKNIFKCKVMIITPYISDGNEIMNNVKFDTLYLDLSDEQIGEINRKYSKNKYYNLYKKANKQNTMILIDEDDDSIT